MASPSPPTSPSSHEPPPVSSKPASFMTSSLVMGLTASLSRVFLYGLNTVEVTGLQRFLDILDGRKDVAKRERGLVTICNHISAFDDPLIWGVLPFRYAFNPSNHRWGLGAHDICFKNSLLSSFFSAGQVLPTYRLQYSPYGGLFQPTMSQAINLLSSRPFWMGPAAPAGDGAIGDQTIPPGSLTSSFSAQNRYSWVHVFPEGCIHQHPKMFLRYFKWGVSRMILESEPVPDVLPIFIDGTQRMLPEDRSWPRFIPRFGVKFRVAFGDLVDTESTFGDLRAQWQELAKRQAKAKSQAPQLPGELSEELKYAEEATMLRIEVARRLRDEVLKVRRGLGYLDEEPPGLELVNAWAREPGKDRFKSNVDDSLVNRRK